MVNGVRHYSRRSYWPVAAVVFFSVAWLASIASAGQTDASLYGLVTDESGAVLPGVTVTVTSPALQVRTVSAVTAADGEYRVTPLPIGIYQVEYTLQGFQTVRQEGIRLTAGSEHSRHRALPVAGPQREPRLRSRRSEPRSERVGLHHSVDRARGGESGLDRAIDE